MRLCATILIALTLSACTLSSSASKATYNIYQPDCLRLEAGKAIQTLDGVYTPQTSEVWYSPKFVDRLQESLL